MAKTYTKEQLEKLFDQLPQELQEAVFSLETSESISDTCSLYGITDERVGKIAEYAGNVLLGILPLADFQKSIQENLSLPEVLAKGIAKEINRFVFYPVKASLEELYRMGVKPQGKQGKENPLRQPADGEKEAEEISEEKPATEEREKEETRTARPQDAYRETIE